MNDFRDTTISTYVREHAESNPESVAIYYYDTSLTYGWLNRSADVLASYWLGKGVEQGDVIAAYMQNCPQFVVAYMAAQRLGAVLSPCNPMLKSKELTYQLGDLNAKAVIAAEELAEELELAEKPSVSDILLVSYGDLLDEQHQENYAFDIPKSTADKLQSSYSVWAEIMQSAGDSMDANGSTPVLIEPDIDTVKDASLIIYTSGTTGQPKGAMLSFRNCTFKAQCAVATYSYTRDDRVSAAMPIFHVAGMLIGMTAPLVSGAAIVLLTRFTPEDFVTVAVKHRMTFSYTTPPMNRAIIATGRAHEIESLRLSIGTSFGSQITQVLSDQWRSYTGQEYFEFAYGMSETHTADSMNVPGKNRWGSTGLPTYETSIWITDPDNRDKRLPVGELGEISIASPAVFLGYKGKAEATAKTMHNGRYYSGDMGRIDEDGYLFFDGRFKEMIKCNGYSVFPEEVEKYLQEHEAVDQAVAIGVPDETRGESVKAFVVLNPEWRGKISEVEIVQWARDTMAAYKYPRAVEFIKEVPQTATGKMLRAKLREQAER